MTIITHHDNGITLTLDLHGLDMSADELAATTAAHVVAITAMLREHAEAIAAARRHLEATDAATTGVPDGVYAAVAQQYGISHLHALLLDGATLLHPDGTDADGDLAAVLALLA
jgi:hypothetical protein